MDYRKNAYLFSIIVAMGGFVFGLDAALISGTVNFIVQEFGLSDIELGTVVSAPGLGVLIALPFAGYASDLLGRKKALLIVAALYLISAIASTLAPDYWTLVMARFLGGLAFSSISLASMYIGEIAPPNLRGKLVAMTQINIVVGLSAAYFINDWILGLSENPTGWVEQVALVDHIWRWMLGSEIVFALIWFVLLFMIPESPAWLLFRNRKAEAESTLSKLYPKEAIAAQIQGILASIEQHAEKRSLISQLKELFGKGMRPIFIVAITIAIAQQATGINAVLFYAPTLFEQMGLGTDAAFTQAIWIGVISVIATSCSLFIIDRFGRRPMTIWGMVWIVLSLSLCSYGFYTARYTITSEALAQMTEVPAKERLEAMVGVEYQRDIDFKQDLKEALGEEDFRKYSSAFLQNSADMDTGLLLVAVLSFIAAFQFSLGPIMWVLFSELFPISLRGTAIPVFALISSVVNYLVQQFFPWQLSNMGGASIFLFYAAIVSVGLVILYRFLPETKNLSIEEIQVKMGVKSSGDSGPETQPFEQMASSVSAK
ncbi:MFS transporter [Pontibacter sp. G13]|uniref:MFS transporter n=1 Tax=Pontibacter sp. G13 TaxID=3074898 RepID=UPI00288A9BB1|nr:MFS transporter [Pontibacter sp. G13]WNJ20569.1 MFS transporter [Pontibacter sp. G13]